MLQDIDINLLSLRDFTDTPEIEEDGESFFENAFKKAMIISKFTGETVLADDSGLEVDYLNGKPGVRSSRYSGDNATDEENIKKILYELTGVSEEQRGAAFRCVLVIYQPDGRFESFEGEFRGMINDKPAGNGGFGYDPVFFVPEIGMTVAQLSPEVKNRISHRAQAFDKLRKSLQ